MVAFFGIYVDSLCFYFCLFLNTVQALSETVKSITAENEWLKEEVERLKSAPNEDQKMPHQEPEMVTNASNRLQEIIEESSTMNTNSVVALKQLVMKRYQTTMGTDDEDESGSPLELTPVSPYILAVFASD